MMRAVMSVCIAAVVVTACVLAVYAVVQLFRGGHRQHKHHIRTAEKNRDEALK